MIFFSLFSSVFNNIATKATVFVAESERRSERCIGTNHTRLPWTPYTTEYTLCSHILFSFISFYPFFSIHILSVFVCWHPRINVTKWIVAFELFFFLFHFAISSFNLFSISICILPNDLWLSIAVSFWGRIHMSNDVMWSINRCFLSTTKYEKLKDRNV